MAGKNPTARRAAPHVPLFIWILAAALATAITWRALAPAGSHHPQPRADITAATIAPADRYAASPDVARVYQLARQIPHLLDGLHCYCECARNFGHRSLLTCFESDHGADCDICLREVLIAAEMNAQGRSLNQIRDRIDALFGG